LRQTQISTISMSFFFNFMVEAINKPEKSSAEVSRLILWFAISYKSKIDITEISYST